MCLRWGSEPLTQIRPWGAVSFPHPSWIKGLLQGEWNDPESGEEDGGVMVARRADGREWEKEREAREAFSE